MIRDMQEVVLPEEPAAPSNYYNVTAECHSLSMPFYLKYRE